MTLHGVTRDLAADGIVEIRNGSAFVTSSFKLALADYDIGIPGVVKDKIAEQADVTLAFELKPMEARP
jgi:hypothetical protein